MRTADPGHARALVLLAAVCFGTTGTAAALGPDDASPVAVGAVRVVLGGLLLAGVGLWAGRRAAGRQRVGLTGGHVPTALVGAVAVAAYQPAFFLGVSSSGVAVGTLVALGTAPVVTGLLEWLLTGCWPGPRWTVATALAGAGVAVLSLAGDGDAARLDPFGVAASVTAGASYAAYTVASKRLLGSGWSADQAMGTVFGAAAVLTALGGAAVLLMAPSWPALDLGWLTERSGAATALFLAVVPTALAYRLFARGLRRLPASEVSTLTLAEPLTAGFLGLLVLREPAGPSFAVGAVLLAAGLTVLSVRLGPSSPDPVADAVADPVRDEPGDVPTGR